MSKQRIQIVNFGSKNAGLSTVAYTLYTPDGGVYKTRTTGAIEYGVNTGIYGAMIDFPDSGDLIVMWDTGTATPIYAAIEGMTAINAIQSETDYIRIIWNTLRNQGDTYNELIKHIRGQKPVTVKDYEEQLNSIISAIESSRKEIVSLEAIKGALNVTVTAPEVVIPEPKVTVNTPNINIPDYSDEISAISKAVRSLSDAVKAIDIKVPERENINAEIKAIAGLIDASKTDLSAVTSSSKESLLSEISALKQRIEALNTGIIKKINGSEEYVANTVKNESEKITKDISSAKDSVEEAGQGIASMIRQLIKPEFLYKIKSGLDGHITKIDDEIKRNRIKKALGVK